MPPVQYRAVHSDARLNATERQELEQGSASWTKDPPGK